MVDTKVNLKWNNVLFSAFLIFGGAVVAPLGIYYGYFGPEPNVLKAIGASILGILFIFLGINNLRGEN